MSYKKIFCAECGKEEFPNCGVNISSWGSISIKLHWECYYNKVDEHWRLERKYGNNSNAVISWEQLPEKDKKRLGKK